MINVSGHLRNERRVTGFADDSVSLSVNCCGMQVFKTKDYSQNRFAGRVDYQLIYVYKGANHFQASIFPHFALYGNEKDTVNDHGTGNQQKDCHGNVIFHHAGLKALHIEIVGTVKNLIL